MTMATATVIEVPALRDDQSRIIERLTDRAQVAVVSCGRRWGKTIMCGVACIAIAAAGYQVAWVAPSYPQSRALWRWLMRTVAPAEGRGVTISRSEHSVYLGGEGMLAVYSAEAPTSILGNAYDLVVVDEAALIPADVWLQYLQPTLADRGGKALLIGTPRGHNWFYHEFQRGVNNESGYMAYRAPTSDNPIASIRAAYERARALLPARIFAQEWDAEFVSDAGGVFVGVRQCVKQLTRKGDVVLGVDIGRDNDYTVVATYDISQSAVIAAERWRHTDYSATVARIERIARDAQPVEVLVEANAAGAAVVDYLLRSGLPVTPVYTTASTKRHIIERLAWAIERREIALPQIDWLLTELEQYTQRRRADGTYDYSAPHGLHDDGVMAVAWAYSRAGVNGPVAEEIV
jgi:hypothetical protein